MVPNYTTRWDSPKATGYAERDCAKDMLNRLPTSKRRRTVAGDKNYDTKALVADVRAAGFTPHVVQNTTNRRSAIDGRTTRHAGYEVSQRIRKRVEEPFGVVRQLVGTTLGGLRHLVWTTLAPAERDHLVGGLPGSVS